MRNCFPIWNLPVDNMESQRAGLSRPPRELVDLWKVAPLVNVLVTCGLLAILWVTPVMPSDLRSNDVSYSWAVDKWYPVTFISRPLPELLFYLILFGIQIGERIAPLRIPWGTETEFP